MKLKSYAEAIAELKPEEVELLELTKEYWQVSNELKDHCKYIDADIEKLINARKEREKQFLEKLADIEQKTRILMIDRKSTFICSFGKINYRKGAITRKWNLDALDQICAADEPLKLKIWPFRTEKEGEPVISIKPADLTTPFEAVHEA